MREELISQIQQLNPWLQDPKLSFLRQKEYITRLQTPKLLLAEWDTLWLILTGPRRAGKTTLGFSLCQSWIASQRFQSLLYLNCDYRLIREWVGNPLFITQAQKQFNITHPIIYIDEAQRLENPGLLLKSIADLQLPIKMIATGSSQLEMKSKVQEHLTGRQLKSLILPFSYPEITGHFNLTDCLIFGCFPQVVQAKEKILMLQQLYKDYITKDIIEFLKIGKADVLEKLLSLVAHSAGQLVNYNQFATDCGINVSTIKHYLDVLEKTYVICKIMPFVGNKRTEITSNPIYYFIDNGFRNQALGNFASLDKRTDSGFLVENAVFQELYKLNTQFFLNLTIYFWRTKAGAEVDFILYQNRQKIIPIEVKYRQMKQTKVSRGFRSFIEAYKPEIAFFITKDYFDTIKIERCIVYFIPISHLTDCLEKIREYFSI